MRRPRLERIQSCALKRKGCHDIGLKLFGKI